MVSVSGYMSGVFFVLTDNSCFVTGGEHILFSFSPFVIFLFKRYNVEISVRILLVQRKYLCWPFMAYLKVQYI